MSPKNRHDHRAGQPRRRRPTFHPLLPTDEAQSSLLHPSFLLGKAPRSANQHLHQQKQPETWHSRNETPCRPKGRALVSRLEHTLNILHISTKSSSESTSARSTTTVYSATSINYKYKNTSIPDTVHGPRYTNCLEYYFF
jgi:hypothetical protein